MIKLILLMPLFSKARPRVTSKGTFMPADYQNKRKEMLRQIKEQYHGNPLEGPISLEVILMGEGRGDGDNIIGALLDTGKGVLWKDDRISIIPEIRMKWIKTKKEASAWFIRIDPLDSEKESEP